MDISKKVSGMPTERDFTLHQPDKDEHRFISYIKVGRCLKSGEMDFLKNTFGIKELCKEEQLEIANLLKCLAREIEDDKA